MAARPGPISVSTTANGLASGNQTDANQANNQAALTIAVAGPPGGTPPPPGDTPPPAGDTPPPPSDEQIEADLSLKVTPAKDEDSPFEFKAKGVLAGAGLDAAACSGKIKLSVKDGRDQVASKSAERNFARGDCTFRKKLKFKRAPAKKLKVRASFAGSDAVAAATSKTARIALG
jgi:hypothetical protein